MAGSGDEMTLGTGDGGHLRASRADRERAVEALKAAFVQGRLTKDEFDLRVGHALTSRTYTDLAAVTAGIPAGPAAAQPVPEPARAQAPSPLEPEIRTGARAILVITVIMAVFWAVAIFTGSVAAFLAACGAAGTAFVVSFMTGTRILGSWLDKRSGCQRPPRPGADAGGQASEPPASAALAERFPQIDHDHRHTAEATRRLISRQQLSYPCDCGDGMRARSRFSGEIAPVRA